MIAKTCSPIKVIRISMRVLKNTTNMVRMRNPRKRKRTADTSMTGTLIT